MNYKILIVGEAWGEHEERQRSPFVGPSGYELTRMLSEAGIHRSECYLTNVFNLRPKGVPNNDIENVCGVDKAGSFPALKNGKYVRPEFFGELKRLAAEIDACKPNVCILLGNTACWAMLGATSISKIRGTITASSPIIGCNSRPKCLPAYHPAAIMRQWDLRPVTVLDFKKARRESEFPEIRRPERKVYLAENLGDIKEYYESQLVPAKAIAFDIETMGDQITCIGFAPSPADALVIPFHDPRQPSASFWPSADLESAAWESVRQILTLPQPKIAQNGMYDVTFLWRAVGITVRNFVEDTMLLHHALQPESEKGLAFLGSVYTNESSWKLLNARKGKTIKRDN